MMFFDPNCCFLMKSDYICYYETTPTETTVKTKVFLGFQVKRIKILLNHTMTQDEFLAQMRLLDPAIAGRGQEIAKDAKVSYNTYLNYKGGKGKDTIIMESILEACRKIAKQVKHHLNSINL